MTSGKLTAYSGLTTKIRAMKKQLLTPAQFEEIAHFTSVAELISYLQTFPSYADVLASIDPALAHRGEVEAKMTFSTYYDFSKIFHFAGTAQKKYLNYFFIKYEVSILKACMRNIMDSRTEVDPILTDKHFKQHTQLDIDKLISCTNMDDFIANLAGTIYEKPLGKIHALEYPVLFDYELTLDLFFFTYIWTHQELFVPRGERKYFVNSFGANIDLLNVLWIYRCKNYYTVSDAQIYSFLIPINYRISNSEIKRMVEAGGNEELFENIKQCYYGKTYGFDPLTSIETQFNEIMHQIYMEDFKKSPYSLAAINAYFHLKNLEIARVVTALECIRYGYKPDVISKYIEQKRGVM